MGNPASPAHPERPPQRRVPPERETATPWPRLLRALRRLRLREGRLARAAQRALIDRALALLNDQLPFTSPTCATASGSPLIQPPPKPPKSTPSLVAVKYELTECGYNRPSPSQVENRRIPSLLAARLLPLSPRTVHFSMKPAAPRKDAL